MNQWPLPIPHHARRDPTDFIPETTDPHGHGERMWQVMGRLKITQGALARKTLAKVAPAWQERFVRSLYGTTDEDGRRVHDLAFLLVGKKNGKSTLTGMLAVAHVLAFPEPRGVGILLAATKEQAKLVADSMVATIMADEWLQTQFHVRGYKNEVEHLPTGTVVRTVAAELASTVGTQPSFFVCDELHLLGQTPKGANLVRQLMSGAAVRENPLGVLISTAPLGVGAGIYQSTYKRAHRVLTGEAQGERLFPVCYELPPDADPNDSRFWWMANPSIDKTFSMEWLKREHGIAMSDPDPSALEHFMSQHLNLAAAEALGVDRLVPLSAWDRTADRSITLESLVERCPKRLWLGLDAGGLDDFTSLAVVGETEDGQTLLWVHSWLHQSGYDKRAASTPLAEFKAAGDLTVFENVNEDLDQVEAVVDDIREHVVAAGVDPHGLRELVRRMEEKGLTVVGIPQGWKMSPHIHQTVRDIHGGSLRQYGGPLTRWCVSNARITERGQAVALTKPNAASVSALKIDAVVAAVMALAVKAEQAPQREAAFDVFFV